MLSKDQRDAIGRAVGQLRTLFEDEFAAQASGRFGLHTAPRAADNGDRGTSKGEDADDGLLDPWVEPLHALSLTPSQVEQRWELVGALRYLRREGLDGGEAVRRLIREAAFTAVNRLLAVRVAEAIGSLPQVTSAGRESAGYRDIIYDLFPLLAADEDQGLWTFVQVCGDELGATVPLLFDRRLPTSAFVPSRARVDDALAIINNADVAEAWGDPEALGWAYQFFNREGERQEMRAASSAPRNSRELAVRNQFFTPGYVVDWLVQNTLGRRLHEAGYHVEVPLLAAHSNDDAPLALEDVRVLDPAVGSGHFLLGCYDLLEEAWSSVGVDRADAAPRILRSLFGIEIDARASQVAQAVLLLRARRSAPQAELEAPAIVTARTFPGDRALRAEAFRGLTANAQDLAKGLEDALSNAPELGTLLKVEQRLEVVTERAVARPKLDSAVVTAESLDMELLGAMTAIAHEADASPADRMFAADARDAIGFVELCRQRYDVILMNPPFGEPVPGTEAYLEAAYGSSGFDLYPAFVRRGLEMLTPNGYLGAITSRTGFFLTRFEGWRSDVVLPRLRALVDLGIGVMHGAMVEAACYVAAASPHREQATFRRLLDAPDKAAAVYDGHGDSFIRRPTDFAAVPGSPAAYWVAPELLEVFRSRPSIAASAQIDARRGAYTGDDFRYLRCWWEVPASGALGESSRWVNFAKGGEYAPYYSHIHLVVDWDYDRGTFRDFHGRKGRSSPVPENRDYFGRPGLTWSLRSQKGFSVRPVPKGCIFGHKGPMVFVESDAAEDLDRAMAFLNSSAAAALLEAMVAFGSYEVGAVQRMPNIDPGEGAGQLAGELTEQRIRDAQRVETDHLFISPWTHSSSSREQFVEASQRIDDAVSHALGRSEPAVPASATYPTKWFQEDFARAGSPTAHEELSYLLGVAFGRWDVRYASGELEPPPLPGAYEALPAHPRGTLVAAPGLSHIPRPSNYPLVLPTDRILHDELGHPHDVVTAIEQAIAVLEDGPRPPHLIVHRAVRDLRRHLRTGFSNDHLRDYSASRRSAPLYWHLTVSSRRWGLWIYAPALDREMLFAIAGAARDKLRRLHQQQERLRGEEVAPRDRDAVARLEGIEALTVELEDFAANAESIAHSGWVPDLNDGLVLCATPLESLLANDRWRTHVAEQAAKLKNGLYPWAAVQGDFFGVST